MTLSQKCQKSDFLGHCSLTQLFHDVEKLRRKPKIFVKVIQRFWYVQQVGVIFLDALASLVLMIETDSLTDSLTDSEIGN